MKYRCGEMGHLALEYDLTNTLLIKEQVRM